ncbi:lantibiotic dehydratase [Streptomyces sp. NPDC056519]|uniref:lantibiotic dehydratase n=1 Tax=Streptomyces sp. NPDC056519 TaxID=3345849 RepID=UPI0036A8EA94
MEQRAALVGVAEIHAADTAALNRGAFELDVVGVSRGAGVGIGRCLSYLEGAEPTALTAHLADQRRARAIPGPALLPPLAPETAHVTCARGVRPTARWTKLPTEGYCPASTPNTPRACMIAALRAAGTHVEPFTPHGAFADFGVFAGVGRAVNNGGHVARARLDGPQNVEHDSPAGQTP